MDTALDETCPISSYCRCLLLYTCHVPRAQTHLPPHTSASKPCNASSHKHVAPPSLCANNALLPSRHRLRRRQCQSPALKKTYPRAHAPRPPHTSAAVASTPAARTKHKPILPQRSTTLPPSAPSRCLRLGCHQPQRSVVLASVEQRLPQVSLAWYQAASTHDLPQQNPSS